MEKDLDETLLKIRSARACISDGLNFYNNSFRHIFRATWFLALGYACLWTIIVAVPTLLIQMLWPSVCLWLVTTVVYLWLAAKILRRRGIFEQIDAKGWGRHVGMVLLVWLVMMLIIGIFLIIILLPAFIIALANWTDLVGVLNGDPSGMPQTVKLLAIIVFMLSGFIHAYVWLTLLFPYYYVRGTHAKRVMEKKELNTSSQ